LGKQKILITGAAGFLGRRLLKVLLKRGTLGDQPIGTIYLADIAPIDPPQSGNAAIEIVTEIGDLADTDYVARLAALGADSIFHLASQLTILAEADPAKAYAVNVEALRLLVEGSKGRPKLVFTSSIAVFGGALPETVGDDQAQSPSTTYGSHKAINELLIADYSRHERIDGRTLRLPIVLIRPGAPQPVISDRVAQILREPLSGARGTSPLQGETRIPIASVGAVVRALLTVHDLPSSVLPLKRAMNMPALSVTVSQMAEAIIRRPDAGEICYAPDPQMQAIVDSWPKRFVSAKASALGIAPDLDIEAIIEDYLSNAK
jgi:nucleoside-diphosphate-sugar epimerase